MQIFWKYCWICFNCRKMFITLVDCNLRFFPINMNGNDLILMDLITNLVCITEMYCPNLIIVILAYTHNKCNNHYGTSNFLTAVNISNFFGFRSLITPSSCSDWKTEMFLRQRIDILANDDLVTSFILYQWFRLICLGCGLVSKCIKSEK